MPADQAKSYIEALRSVDQQLKAHVWFATSGSSGQHKWVALSKQALLISAEAVNVHLGANASDIWLLALPTFHVGGVGILARAHLSGSKVEVFDQKWEALAFCRALEQSKATLTSLVPAQVYDFVSKQLRPTGALRAAIVGGGALTPELFSQAFLLGWPILPSYGMSECSSQIATAVPCEPYSRAMKILGHVQVAASQQGRLLVKSAALLSYYAHFNRARATVELIDPKEDGWFASEDLGEVRDEQLFVYGRCSDWLKIGGESVDLGWLRSIFDEVKKEVGIAVEKAVLFALPDERLGHVINVAAARADVSPSALQKLLLAYQSKVLPYERIRMAYLVEKIPFSALGKLQTAELLALLPCATPLLS